MFSSSLPFALSASPRTVRTESCNGSARRRPKLDISPAAGGTTIFSIASCPATSQANIGPAPRTPQEPFHGGRDLSPPSPPATLPQSWRQQFSEHRWRHRSLSSVAASRPTHQWLRRQTLVSTAALRQAGNLGSTCLEQERHP